MIRIIILDTLLRQISDKKISTELIRRLYDEFGNLSMLEKNADIVINYIKKNDDGIKFKGINSIPLFKFRISSGDNMK